LKRRHLQQADAQWELFWLLSHPYRPKFRVLPESGINTQQTNKNKQKKGGGGAEVNQKHHFKKRVTSAIVGNEAALEL
jgi:hypothetical protein